MKRICSIFAVAVIFVTLTGCGKPATSDSDSTTSYDPDKDPLVNPPSLFEPPPEDDSLIASDETPGLTTALEELLESVDAAFEITELGPPPYDLRVDPDTSARHRRQMHELDRHSQRLLIESADVRDAYFTDMKTDSLEAFAESIVGGRSTVSIRGGER